MALLTQSNLLFVSCNRWWSCYSSAAEFKIPTDDEMSNLTHSQPSPSKMVTMFQREKPAKSRKDAVFKAFHVSLCEQNALTVLPPVWICQIFFDNVAKS